MNTPLKVAAYVLVILLAGYGLVQAGFGASGFYKDLAFLRNSRLLSEYREAMKAAQPKPPVEAPK